MRALPRNAEPSFWHRSPCCASRRTESAPYRSVRNRTRVLGDTSRERTGQIRWFPCVFVRSSVRSFFVVSDPRQFQEFRHRATDRIHLFGVGEGGQAVPVRQGDRPRIAVHQHPDRLEGGPRQDRPVEGQPPPPVRNARGAGVRGQQHPEQLQRVVPLRRRGGNRCGGCRAPEAERRERVAEQVQGQAPRAAGAGLPEGTGVRGHRQPEGPGGGFRARTVDPARGVEGRPRASSLRRGTRRPAGKLRALAVVLVVVVVVVIVVVIVVQVSLGFDGFSFEVGDKERRRRRHRGSHCLAFRGHKGVGRRNRERRKDQEITSGKRSYSHDVCR
mmetsp:Transcript_26540/g.54765  ORF Transcript_26540/g.54765 Transcript_26540/m.54765 type:complete len:330 (-) Transcript_26540:413-1402(-)